MSLMFLLFITLVLWDDCLALRTDQYPKDSSHECQRPYDWQSNRLSIFPVNIVIPCLRPLKASSLTVVDPAESDTDRHQVQSTMAGKAPPVTTIRTLRRTRNSRANLCDTGRRIMQGCALP
jgi:hypothetical protein